MSVQLIVYPQSYEGEYSAITSTANDFIVDGILKDDEFFVHDIISYDGSDTSDMKTNDRLKILRGQLESHDGISVPGPFNTRVTDSEGLESAVNELKEDGYLMMDRI